MSDTESHRLASLARDLLEKVHNTDEVLNDHRNQPASLPIRQQENDHAAVEASEARLRNPAFARLLRTDYYANQPDDDDENDSAPPLVKRSSRAVRSKLKLLSEAIHRTISGQNQGQNLTVPAGILRKKTRRGSNAEEALDFISRQKTNDSINLYRRERRGLRSLISLDDSHGSRTSQETEEDVCFPMLKEHVRINGIDFDEIEEFIKEELEEEEYVKEQQQILAEKTAQRVKTSSSAAMKYTPKNILLRSTTKESKAIKEEEKSDSSTVKSESSFSPHIHTKIASGFDDLSSDKVKFGSTRMNDGATSLPERFLFFCLESEETVHAPDIPLLVGPGQSVRELFRNGEATWWLDCSCPTDSEMKMLAKAFGIHPLTAEDIRMQETREKVELFKTYYFVCFHTFEPDKESEDYLEPINVYIVVFREGILTFHFLPILHPANVRRRVRQLRDYVDVSADWLCYALIDDITDEFAPVITGIEYEADAIEDSVFVARELDFSYMLQRIGELRRKVMTLMRLLSGKADVIKMFAKRCQDEAAAITVAQPQHADDGTTASGLQQPGIGFNPAGYVRVPLAPSGRAQPRADIALYLGDIQDHVVTMFQNLLAYEKIFSRSHSNYLAQLQVESFNLNNKVTAILSKVTIIGTIIVPLNIITGLFGMNVHIPGQGVEGLGWFFGIVGVMVFLILTSLLAARFWLLGSEQTSTPGTAGRSIKSLGIRNRTRGVAKLIISFPNKFD